MCCAITEEWRSMKSKIAKSYGVLLLGQKDCDLRVEYYPNTKTAVKISSY